MALNLLSSVIVMLSSAVVAATVFRRLNLPPVLGYLTVGLTVGPFGLGLVDNTESTRDLAEFGVVFLMFTIGLEFSIAKLLSMKRLVIGLGGLQVLVTTLITSGIIYFFNHSLAAVIVIGGIVAMSSTAIVVKQLQEQFEINTAHGNNAIGILLFQDVAVIAFLILVPSLDAGGDQNLLIPLGWALLKAIAVMVVILLAGRWILRPLFHEIASSKSLELFTLAILLVTLGAAWLTEEMGLSMALGAFVAGMMLGETEYRHQIEVEIRPFRDVLLGLFFVTIGMLLDLHQLPDIWLQVLILLTAMILLKLLLISGLSFLLGSDVFTSWRTGFILAQGGEFGFALLTLALGSNLLTPEINQTILGALFFSIALAPFLIRYNERLARSIAPKTAKISEEQAQQDIATTCQGLKKHVIICGFGRVGQNIARILGTEGFEFIALDMDPERVQVAQLAGERVTYGNSSNLSILLAAGLGRASALILSFEDPHAQETIIPQVRQVYPELPILVRTRDDANLQHFLDLGATEIVPETLEASLMLAFHALVLLNVKSRRAITQISKIRRDRYELLHHVFPSHDMEDLGDLEKNREQLYVLSLGDSAAAIGKTLESFELEKHEVSVSAIRRGSIRRPEPAPETVFEQGDILVLYGTPPHLEHVERLLLEGHH